MKKSKLKQNRISQRIFLKTGPPLAGGGVGRKGEERGGDGEEVGGRGGGGEEGLTQ